MSGYVQQTLDAIEEQLEDLHDYVYGEWGDSANRILHKIGEAVGPVRRARDGAEEMEI